MLTLNNAQNEFIKNILYSLEKNVIPWQATWDVTITRPYNAISDKAYRGINELNLWMTSMRHGFDDPRWMTFKQANEKGYRIKKGSVGTYIYNYALRNIETKEIVSPSEYAQLDDETKEKIKPYTKTYKVFNAKQIDGIPELDIKSKAVLFENDKAEKFSNTLFKNIDLEVVQYGNKACYIPSIDKIHIPNKESFMDEQSYYAVLMHETSHATSNVKRLNRELSTVFGSDSYAIEELRAELTSAFMTLDLGFHFDKFHEENHIAYVQSWIKQIREDPQVIFSAISDAQRIREYLLDKGSYEEIYIQEDQHLADQAVIDAYGYHPSNLEHVIPMPYEKFPYGFECILNEKEAVILYSLGVPIIAQYGYLDKEQNFYTNIQLNEITQSMSMDAENEWQNKNEIVVAGHKITKDEDLIILRDQYAHGYIDPALISIDDMPTFINCFEYLTDAKFNILDENTCNIIQQEMIESAPITLNKLMEFRDKYITEDILERAAQDKEWQLVAKRKQVDPLTLLQKNLGIGLSLANEQQVIKEAIEKKVDPSLSKETIVINLFAGPGAGKTTCAWEIASKLKKMGYATEYVPEYAKELVWDERRDLLGGEIENQRLILSEQEHRVDRLIGKVDFVVTDAPALLNLNFLKCDDQKLVEEYKESVLNKFNSYHNFNLFVNRGDTYETIGRVHTLEQSIKLDQSLKTLLDENKLFYGTYNHATVDAAITNCIKTYKRFNKSLDTTMHSNTPKEQNSVSLDDMKNSISITEYAQEILGFNVIKETRGLFRIEQHDSCKIYPNNTFYRYSHSVGGSIIDFIKHFEECDTKEAIEKMKDYYGKYHPEVHFDTSKQKNMNSERYHDMELPEKSDTNKHIYAYLTKTRGIKPSIVKEYLDRKILYEDTNKNCVFVGKLNNHIEYATLRSSNPKVSFKQDVFGSIKEVGIYVDNSSDTLVVNEAVIDQMSYQCLAEQPKAYNYLSCCGAANAMSAIRFHMSKRSEAKNLKKIIIGLDNDEAGEKNTIKAIDFLKEKYPDIETMVHIPEQNDFNDQLRNEMSMFSNLAQDVDNQEIINMSNI